MTDQKPHPDAEVPSAGRPLEDAAAAHDVAERGRAEEELKRRNVFVETLLEHAPIGFAISTISDGRAVFVSRRFESIYGLAPGSLHGVADFFELVYLDPAFRETIRARVMADIESGDPARMRWEDIPITTKAGDHRVVTATNIPLPDQDLMVSTVQDVTERKNAEKQLVYVMTAVESTSEAIGISDAQGHHFYQNKALSDLFEYATAEELEAAGGGRAVVKDPAVARTLFDTIMGGGSWAGELEMVTRSGRVFEAYERADAVRDRQGNIVGLIGIVSDISRWKRSEEVLRNLRKAVDTSGESVFLTDLDGIITYVNPAFTALYGYTADEVVGKVTPRILKSGFLDPWTNEQLWKTLSSGQEVRAEYSNRKKDGQLIPVEGAASPIIDDAKGIVGFLGVERDITKRRQAEEARDRMEAQLLQAQKMEAVGRLAGGVAHDFNNMLGVILGHVELAIGQVDPGHAIVADLEGIRTAASRSADLTRQLLAFARKQTVVPRVLDLNDTIARMITILRRLIGEDVELVWRPGADLWPVKVDPSQIDQFLANLCVNARDAIADVGIITIDTGNRVFDEADCARHLGSSPGEYVRLSVSDTGCGMDTDTLSHLFEPFFTTKATGKGTGLGLATVYGAVKQNNGFLDVISEPDRGSTFAIYLPRHVPAANQAQTESAAGQALGGDETILLVEDEPALLKLATAMLERLGYTVLVARAPGDALRLVRDYGGPVHLLVTDVIMPEMNGGDLASRVLSVYPEIKRLFMSGYSADVIAHHGVLDPGVHFIQKPFSRENLATKVREALEG